MFSNNIVTKDDYLNAFGIDLDMEIPDGDAPNGKVERYIWRIENYCKGELSRYKYQEVNEKNIQRFKNGVMMMIHYSLRAGLANLKGLTDEAFNEFRLGGFCNMITQGDFSG